MTFLVKDVPVFYFPYFVFPANTQRESGFLIPRIGYSNRRGYQYEQPFFWAISKSTDATIATDLESAARVGIIGEYRYMLSREARGSFTAAYYNENIRGNTKGTLEPDGTPAPRRPPGRAPVRPGDRLPARAGLRRPARRPGARAAAALSPGAGAARLALRPGARDGVPPDQRRAGGARGAGGGRGGDPPLPDRARAAAPRHRSHARAGGGPRAGGHRARARVHLPAPRPGEAPAHDRARAGVPLRAAGGAPDLRPEAPGLPPDARAERQTRQQLQRDAVQRRLPLRRSRCDQPAELPLLRAHHAAARPGSDGGREQRRGDARAGPDRSRDAAAGPLRRRAAGLRGSAGAGRGARRGAPCRHRAPRAGARLDPARLRRLASPGRRQPRERHRRRGSPDAARLPRAHLQHDGRRRAARDPRPLDRAPPARALVDAAEHRAQLPESDHHRPLVPLHPERREPERADARARVAAPEQRRGERARRLVLPAARRLPGLHLPLPLRPEHDDPGDDDARPSLPRARLPRAPHLALQLLGAPGGGLRQDEPGRAPLPRPVHALRARLLRADSRPSRLRGLPAARADAAAGRRPGGAGRALQLMTHGPATREPGRP